MPPTGSHRLVQVVAGGTAVVVLTSVLLTSTAPADPIVDARAEAATLARTIDAQGRQMEQLAEQYDGARLHAEQTDSRLAGAEADLATATARALSARTEVSRQAVEAYVHNGYLGRPSPAPFSGHVDLAVQKGYFALATGNEVAALGRLRAAEQLLGRQRRELQSAQADARAAVVSLAARSQVVAQAEAADKATLAQVQGQLVQLVAEQEAQLMAARVAQEQRALAVQAQAQAAATARAAAAIQLAATASAQAQAAAAARARAVTQTRVVTATVGPGPGEGAGATTSVVPRTSPTAPAPGPKPVLGPPAPPPPPAGGAGLVALAYARAQLGKPYEWGAAGPGSFDCSGLSMRAWQAAGVSLPHFAAAQYADIPHVAISALQPGDLVFFGADVHHVGIYAGNGQMIDAPYTGTVVRYDSIYWGDLLGGGRPG